MSASLDYVSDLERRLAEAEETLRAIRDGEVDALLVRGASADEVFHIGGGGESYRAFMEAMESGAAALGADGRLIYANASLACLLQEPVDTLLGRTLVDALGADAATPVATLLDDARAGRQSTQIALDRGSGRRHVVVAAAPLAMDFASGWAVTFTDITERMEAAAAEESERIGRAIMASANEAVVVCDTAGIITHASAAVLDIVAESPVGRRFEDVFSLAFGPGAGPMAADDVVAVAVSGSAIRGIEADLVGNARVRDVLLSAAPLRHAGGVTRGCIITLMDLTERKVIEKRQSLLMRELDHRMKNMLALVQSISARTLSSAVDLTDFGDRFSKRIAALATTQDLLAERSWTSLSVAALLEGELAPYVSTRSPRVRLHDLSAEISRDAAVALGLVFHELVTNAVKYGSLAGERGVLDVRSSRTEDGHLRITWRETGGQAVTAPQRRGFGQTVIARGLGHSAAAPTEVLFEQTGITCHITLSSDVLV